jgi:hypothetical protein
MLVNCTVSLSASLVILSYLSPASPNQDEARCKAEYLRNFAKSSLALGFCVFKEENLTPDIRFINPPTSGIFLISCTITPYKVDLELQALLAARTAACAATFFLLRVAVWVGVWQRWRTLTNMRPRSTLAERIRRERPSREDTTREAYSGIPLRNAPPFQN